MTNASSVDKQRQNALMRLVDIAEKKELFRPQSVDRLTEALSDDEDIKLFLTVSEEPVAELLALAESQDSWRSHPERWALITIVLQSLLRPETEPSVKDSDEEESVEEDEDEGGSESRAMRKVTHTLSKNFTYWPQITLIVTNKIKNSRITSYHYNRTVVTLGKVKSGWFRFKGFLQSLLDLVGLSLKLWRKVMRKWAAVNVVTRVVGTLLTAVLAVLAYFLLPLMRWLTNPLQKFLRWFSREFEVDVEDIEE